MDPSSSSKPFVGVRFVLFGFDPVTQSQVRTKLLSGGGVDAGLYSQNCTHVIVNKIVHDDPLCITARNDGKSVVTGLWVDHSFDIGMAVDTSSIMYRPPRDLNGIPGASNLIICLTGYQRHDREDIMTMVSLMGARFSKPLVASKVTHLICYKFEGEKYELAYRLKTIKLVNHRWLEDCLKEWELLPENNYCKSGYEMEMMEAEAKDSEEEGDKITERQLNNKVVNKSPQLKIGTPRHSPLPKSLSEVPNAMCNLGEHENATGVANDLLATGRKLGNDPASDFNTGNIPVEPHCMDAGTYSGLSNARGASPNFKRGDIVSESLSVCAEKSHSDSRSSAVSYTSKRPRGSPLSIFSGEPNKIGGSPKTQLGGPSSVTPDKDSSVTPGKDESVKDITGSVHSEYFQGSEAIYKEASSNKEKADVSCSKLKEKSTSPDCRASVQKISSECCEVRQAGSVSLVDGLSGINKCSTPDAKRGSVSSSGSKKSPVDISIPKLSESEDRPSTEGPLVSENLTPKVLHDESLKKKPRQLFSSGLRKSSSVGRPEDVEQSEHLNVEASAKSHQAPSPSNGNKEVEKSQTVKMGDLQEVDGNSLTKPVRKKTIAKRTWGSRPTLKKAAKQKGSIYSSKASIENDHEIGLSTEMEAVEKSNNANEAETLPAAVSVAEVKEVETTKCSKSSEANVEVEANLMDDETEPPEDKDESVDVHNEDNLERPQLLHKSDDMMDIEPEAAQHPTKNVSSGTNDSLNEEGSIQIEQKDEPLRKNGSRKTGVSKSKQKELVENQTKTVPSVFEEAASENPTDKQEPTDDKKSQGKPVKKQKAKADSKKPVKRKSASKKCSMEIDKENKPIVEGYEAKDHTGHGVASNSASPEVQKKSSKIHAKSLHQTEDRSLTEVKPACFIVSGHRLQRKEFQQVIRRLKGKFCRDSHQWSYQATHFIAPDPIRRTEKFFAAAASGRWILKTDYLSACSQAGKFLDEEPYEWHKNGLSEDGAINLEAPRKWRLLQEKTGHGAFYGMRIIIYGECIAPPLDTLKRVVKAGDGTILATSPPYSRFLTSGVDFAVVSPGMPRADMWVQEFLQHEIPCVVADYLVEYVCKPGYSLERHVLYNTHAWAEKSLAKLSRKAEEIVENLLSDDEKENDVGCEVCGSFDRGDVMLICGDESGSVGCGKGMHIDCCDPPLDGIPEDDWFCPKCSNASKGSASLKKRKRGSSVKNK